MRERQFIEQNKEKWKAFEGLIGKKGNDPDKLGKLFVEITDDLSYARTFYPNRSVRVYLNKLAQQVFNQLYKSRKRRKNPFLSFFVDDIPSAVFYARKELLLSLIIFVLSIAVGVFSAIQDPDFTKSILSDHYVEMTEANIEKNDPMAVYKGSNQLSMFARIATNNLIIDFKTFLSGLLFGLWTIIMLVYNGIMVGAFQYFFVERGLFSESFLTIWMHGALELSAAVIAGGAGLILGRGLVFPGTYSRLQSLMIAAKQGLKILLIAVVMTTFAAVIESFVTRYTDISNVVRLVWIALSFVFVIGYFMVLPYLKWSKGTLLAKPEEKLQEDLNFNLELTEIKSIGRLFSDAYGIYRKTLGSYLPIIVVTSILFTALNVAFTYTTIYEYFQFDSDEYTHGPFASVVWTFSNLGVIFSPSSFDLRLIFNALVLIIAFSFSLLSMRKILVNSDIGERLQSSDYSKAVGLSLVLAVVVILTALLPNSWVWLLFLSPLPFVMVLLTSMEQGEKLADSVKLMSIKIWTTYALFLSFVLISSIVFTLLTSAVFAIFFSFAEMLFDLESIDAYKIYVIVYIFFCCFALLFVIPPVIYGFGMVSFSNKERIMAKGLEKKLDFLIEEEI
ncbi:MAG: stage II sporulation protein M [Bacteroidetes bacterium]|nr:stage II sporulation protein M [Bacteroidota bacterium]